MTGDKSPYVIKRFNEDAGKRGDYLKNLRLELLHKFTDSGLRTHGSNMCLWS